MTSLFKTRSLAFSNCIVLALIPSIIYPPNNLFILDKLPTIKSESFTNDDFDPSHKLKLEIQLHIKQYYAQRDHQLWQYLSAKMD